MTDASHALAPQDLTLTILGDYVFADRRPAWSGGLVRLLEGFGFTTASVRLALSRLNRRGLIVGTKVGRQTYYLPTEATYQLLAEGQAQIFRFGRDEPWDEQWTVLAYSLPERQRAIRQRLRKRLSFLGFASLYETTWLSPRDRVDAVAALLAELDLEGNAHVFRGRICHGPDVREVIQRGWDLAQLAHRYAGFVAAFEPYASASARAALSDEDAFLIRTRAIHEFKRFPSFDPDLPEELVGGTWSRSEAVAVFHTVYEGLAEPAQRWFAEVARAK